jgi:hypothetical protein
MVEACGAGDCWITKAGVESWLLQHRTPVAPEDIPVYIQCFLSHQQQPWTNPTPNPPTSATAEGLLVVRRCPPRSNRLRSTTPACWQRAMQPRTAA